MHYFIFREILWGYSSYLATSSGKHIFRSDQYMCKLTLFDFYISVSGFPFLSAGKPTPKSRGYFLKLYTFLGGLSSHHLGIETWMLLYCGFWYLESMYDQIRIRIYDYGWNSLALELQGESGISCLWYLLIVSIP